MPDRLQDNIVSGYAVYADWQAVDRNPSVFRGLIEFSLDTSKTRINSTQPTMRRNTNVGM